MGVFSPRNVLLSSASVWNISWILMCWLIVNRRILLKHGFEKKFHVFIYYAGTYSTLRGMPLCRRTCAGRSSANLERLIRKLSLFSRNKECASLTDNNKYLILTSQISPLIRSFLKSSLLGAWCDTMSSSSNLSGWTLSGICFFLSLFSGL